MAKIKKYETIEEASQATIALNIKSAAEYNNQYKEDSKLPAHPDSYYSTNWEAFGKWNGFLGKEVKDFYLTIKVASQATIALNITSLTEYNMRYKEDPRLPASPNAYYSDDWQTFGKWNGFLGKEVKNFYLTIEEASQATIALKITSLTEYKKHYKEDPRLPASPDAYYSDNWEAFGKFNGYFDNEIRDFYPTIETASQAAIALKVTTIAEYNRRYKEDPLLPATPYSYYSADWEAFGKWIGFLGKKVKNFYPTIKAASQASVALKISSITEYKKRYQEDPRLPASPDLYYSDDWEAFGKFNGYFDKEIRNFYSTIEAASQAAIALKITTLAEYVRRYKEDPLLPANPFSYYIDDWEAFGKWTGFLGNEIKDFYPTIEEASQAAIALNMNSTDYNKRYQEDPRLPASPNDYYSDDWEAFGKFNGFFGIQVASIENIDAKYSGWLGLYEKYNAQEQRNLPKKERTLKGFLFHFIQKYQYSEKPELFLHKSTEVNFDHYEVFLNTFGEKSKTGFHTIVMDFIDFALKELCTDDDDDEIIVLPDYINRFKRFQSDLLHIKSETLHESVKPCLPFQYVCDAREWIIPNTATSFSDLKHLFELCEADWFDVDPSVIDKNDPDCIFKETVKDRRKRGTGESHKEVVWQMWSPVRFLALYTLLVVPLRGQQILWLDSGEADKLIPFMENNKIQWKKNDLPLAGQLKHQGFIKKQSENESGLHVTTNKTSAKEGGYDIHWIPENFAPWIIRLRDWQSKYNPIDRPTKWTEINLRVKIGNKILKHRGSNCFLFRQPKSSSPYLQPIFHPALSYVLHQIEDPENRLTTSKNNKKAFKSYNSEYTPHSLRVSLITAFVIDAKVPIHIVQKLVGHARIVMTIYYTKIGHSEMRDALSNADKRALANSPLRLQQKFRDKKMEEAKSELVSNSPELLNNLGSSHPTSSFVFTDIGICPVGGGRCDEGGEVYHTQGKSKFYGAVPAGYLGMKNCIRCRFFMTGSAFLGGLTAKGNEISLQSNIKSKKYNDHLIYVNNLEDEQYDCEQVDVLFTKSGELDKAESEMEMLAKEMDMYLCDFVSISRLINQSVALLNESGKDKNSSDKNMLVANSNIDLIEFSLDETNSEFHQLSEVCENAEIYALADASSAIPRRSQLIDKMAMNNGIQPSMFALSEDQQLTVGNHMSQLLLSRFKTWDNVEKLMSSELYLSDLSDREQLIEIKSEVKNILNKHNGNLNFQLTKKI